MHLYVHDGSKGTLIFPARVAPVPRVPLLPELARHGALPVCDVHGSYHRQAGGHPEPGNCYESMHNTYIGLKLVLFGIFSTQWDQELHLDDVMFICSSLILQCTDRNQSRVELLISSAQHRLFVTAHADRNEAVLLHGPVRNIDIIQARLIETFPKGRGRRVPSLRERDARGEGGREVRQYKDGHEK